MRTTIRLDTALHIRAKAQAAREGRTLASLIEEGLRLVLLRGDRIVLPVCKSSGGVRDGVDLNSNAGLLDLLDAG